MRSFGPFRIDTVNHCLWRAEARVPLTPKAFDVLRYLVERAGRLVSQEEILNALWTDTYVNPEGIRKYILEIRKVLGDQRRPAFFIETVPKRGYRFIAEVADERSTGTAAESAVGLTQPTLLRPHADMFEVNSFHPANIFLGRETELAKMRGWLCRALAAERQVVFVTGEPGIGKTTVVQNFLEEAARIPDVCVAQGQSVEHYGASEAYLPVLDGLSRLYRSQGGTPALDVWRQQAPAWLAQMPSVVLQSDMETLTARAFGATHERMLRQMADAIEVLSMRSPFVLVLEDLHWSDYSTLELISYLARRRESARLMIIGTYRPVDVILAEHPLKRVKTELQAHGLCRELPLERFEEETVRKYLRFRFPNHQLPARLRQTIYRRTEGNPLFMVNLVDYLVDRKTIVEEQGAWKLHAGLLQIEQEIPANLLQLIETQIERLSSDERVVLEAASVAGMECSLVAIAAGLDMPMDWVEKQCQELAQRHQFLSLAWLVELPDGSITPQHRFMHILYRDVPYRLIPPMRRSQIHQRIAECGVAIYGDRAREIAAELAMHFEQSRDWRRALQYIVQAADNASHKSAHDDAAELAKRGLAIVKQVPESTERAKQEITLRMILSVSLMAVKGFASPEVEAVHADGGELFRLSDPSSQLFNVLYLLGLFYIVGGKIRSALEIADQLLKIAEELRDPTLAMEAHRAKGATLIEMGRCSEALEHFNRASDLYSANRHLPYTLKIGHDCKVLVECSAARALWALGFPDTALDRMQNGLAFAMELSQPESQMAASHCAAELHRLRGEAVLAKERASEVLRLAEENGLELWIAFGKIDLGSADTELGDIQHGIEQMEQGLAAYEATGGQLWLPLSLCSLADALAKAGQVQRGMAAITRALVMAELNCDGFPQPELHRIKGELLIKGVDLARANNVPNASATSRDRFAEELAQAQACFAEALLIAKEQQTRSWELRVQLSMDRLAQRQGSPVHAQLAESYSSFSEGFDTADLKEAMTRLKGFCESASSAAGTVNRDAAKGARV